MSSFITKSKIAKSYIPSFVQPSPKDIDSLREFISKYKCCVITGAGISTESGIPDYR